MIITLPASAHANGDLSSSWYYTGSDYSIVGKVESGKFADVPVPVIDESTLTAENLIASWSYSGSRLSILGPVNSEPMIQEMSSYEVSKSNELQNF
ncbi:MAG: hypothetical protein ACE5E9_14425 [Nitrospinaceae bacterium]